MGWVTLTLRKTELKRTHSDYQMDLLRISREKRQMARQNHYEQTLVRNDQSSELRALKDSYNANRDSIREGMNTDGITDSEKSSLQQELQDAQEDYQYNSNAIKEDYEAQLEMLEEEANDTETDLDQQQVEIEAQLEAISAEIESVGEAISSQIQASTIKLS